jgi:hypothetical protein
MTTYSDRDLGTIVTHLVGNKPADESLEWYVLACRIVSLSIEHTALARSGRADPAVDEELRVATSRLAQMLIEPHVHDGLQERLAPLLLTQKVRPQ